MRCAAYVDLRRLAANYNLCKGKCNKVIAVVKADAYGHGAVQVAKTLEGEGCTAFAVSNIDEALELRVEGICGEIILLGYTPQSRYKELCKYDITPLVYDSTSYAEVKRAGISCYLKIDTGMRRLGFYPSDKILAEIATDKQLKIHGIFTHLSVADSLCDSDVRFTARQIKIFSRTADEIKSKSPEAKLYCCNSAAAMRYPFLFDGARIGISLYGVRPSAQVIEDGVLPVMTLKSTVSSVKTVKKGSCVGYGRTCRLKDTRTLAVIAVGYADGYRRSLSNCGEVIIDGRRASVLGTVTMDQTIIDVTDVRCNVGDEVLIFGDALRVEEVAEKANTIPYEILCGVSKRVPRIYLY